MAFIGNTVQNQGFTPAIDYFNGNGVTVTFTLSRPIASVAQVIVAVDNVIQNPSSAFNVVGNSITFTSAPLSGTNNIWVEYTSLITTYQGISQDPTVIGDIRATGGYLAEGDFGNSFIDGNLIDYVTGRGRFTVGELDDITFYHGGTSGRSAMMDLYYAGGAKVYGTTALTIPVGTTGERPGTPAVGMVRYNTTLNTFEVYQNGAWTQYAISYSIDYLILAGGGSGGGGYAGGGGGAGGLLSGSIALLTNSSYTITVGAGGSTQTSAATAGNSGANSSAFSLTAIGGGGGGSSGPGGGGGSSGYNSGNSGGSGGGATKNGTGGAGTSGQGFAGGIGWDGFSTITTCGGGGGAGAVGSPALQSNSPSNGGNGGVGINWQSLGTFYGGGGGGGTDKAGGGPAGVGSVGGTGGNGGGGNGGAWTDTLATAGTANTGGGGGGGSSTIGSYVNGAAGGSGIVIIRYLGAQRGSGGTVTSAGGYTYHTFTSSSTYTS